MGGKSPKQFLEIKGKALILYSLETLLRFGFDPPFVIVAHPDFIKETQELVLTHVRRTNLDTERLDILVVQGGETRHDSTAEGVKALFAATEAGDEDILLIHDAARPVIREREISCLLALFEKPDCRLASLASSVTETLFSFDPKRGVALSPIDRKKSKSIKTPQAILISAWRELSKTLADKDSTHFTDLLTFGQAGGLLGYLAEAEASNLKLTHPGDLPLLEKFLESI